jgi:hypothetical protein
MEWKPASVGDVKEIVRGELGQCDEQQLATFQQHSVEPYRATILRYGKSESVVVVARRGDEVIYWEDVEEGFNVSPISKDGHILVHLCNQDQLRHALNFWIDGRDRSTKLGPSLPA